MPELPEVESVRRLMERVLVGQKIQKVEVLTDIIVFSGSPPSTIRKALQGRTVTAVGRKGKTWWLEFEDKPWVYGHLGMTGWIREIGGKDTKLMEQGEAPSFDEKGKPRFLKLLIETEGGGQIAFTDARRLGRIWLVKDPAKDKRLKQVGPDAMLEMPSPGGFHELIQKRRVAIKTVLMDQSVLSGIGNWVADEVLYQARIDPRRLASSLSETESKRLRNTIRSVLKTSVDADADFEKFPKTWLFHHRWGGSRGKDTIMGKKIVRETIGGRTAAWVPAVQK